MKTAEIGGVACWKLGLEKSSVWSEIAAYLE
jgi:spore germination protein YaaH